MLETWKIWWQNLWFKWSLIIAAILLVLVGLAYVANWGINANLSDKILKGVSLGSNDLSGLNKDEARKVLQQKIDFLSRRGFVYQHPLKTLTVYPTVTSLESADTSYPLVSWDIEPSLDQIFAWQNDKAITNFLPKLQALIFKKNFVLSYQWDEQQHLTMLQTGLAGVLMPKNEANFEIKNNEVSFTTEQSGQTFDFVMAMAETKKQITSLQNQDIILQVQIDEPNIKKTELEKLKTDILETKDLGEFNLAFAEEKWEVKNTSWQKWLRAKYKDKKIYLGFDKDLVEKYFELNSIKEKIEVPVQDARFQVVGGRVKEFATSQKGISLDWENIISSLEEKLANADLNITLAVKEIEPKISNSNVNGLGITEIIGTGKSDFTGSPKNRIHNINVGADSLNGILIAPQEEFSLLKALGEIDGEHGYLQELVIKDNKTIPEFGDGLCQIGTTAFRSALASGLPITQRRNHSYRVVYYEPAGTDATIYSPWPDFRFLNDTEKYILIQTRIEGTKLYFDFWGTKDGREVIMTDPVIYNIVQPPEKRIIKTIDLEPSKTKCTERAHNGADARFDYTVKYPNQSEAKVATFYSHYVPWQEVCLLGVTQEELDGENNTSSTPEVTPPAEVVPN